MGYQAGVYIKGNRNSWFNYWFKLIREAQEKYLNQLI